MAGYFNGSAEIQPDGLQTLYLMNPSLVESSSPPPSSAANMVLFNPSMMGSLNHSHQHLMGIPLQRPPSSVPLWAPAPSHQPLSLGLARHRGPHTAAEQELSPDSSRASSMQGVFMGSKYLKAAQQLLDEAVSVGGGIDRGELAKDADSMKGGSRGSGGEKADASSKRGEDLTNAERQELHMKKGKLANMLDEVEQRYRQYRHQMQIIVSSFEVIAGIGSARTYTALALQTISKQFRSLRDAISGEIRAASRSLGEDDPLTGGANSVGSRLRFVDHHLRQQRALQQIGMIHHNTWRPQRGLPERAVSVLRAWLFEHFLHPYPKDSDKHMLAKQTGLTRSQVSNWFINARVRLWKPMVEEMYLEESKDQEPNNGNGNASDPHGDEESKFSAQHEMMIPTRTTQTDILESNEPRAHPIGTPSSVLGIVEDHDAITQHCVKRSRVDLDEMRNHELLMKFMEAKNSTNYGYDNLMQGGNNIGIAGYSIGEIDRFNDDHGQYPPRFSGNGVSLTLGLHSEESPSLSGMQPSYLSSENIPLGRRVEMNNPPSDDYFSLNNNNTSAPHPPIAYESITIQNRKRFNAQILQDFVA